MMENYNNTCLVHMSLSIFAFWNTFEMLWHHIGLRTNLNLKQSFDCVLIVIRRKKKKEVSPIHFCISILKWCVIQYIALQDSRKYKHKIIFKPIAVRINKHNQIKELPMPQKYSFQFSKMLLDIIEKKYIEQKNYSVWSSSRTTNG